MKNVDVTAGVLVQGDRVLLTRRAPGEKHAGGWEFPGGKIEAGETAPACLARELQEELNIQVEVGRFCHENTHQYEEVAVHLLAYYCKLAAGTIEKSVHDRFLWVPIRDLLTYDLLPADVPIAKKVQRDYGTEE